jgi:hypothetical protein
VDVNEAVGQDDRRGEGDFLDRINRINRILGGKDRMTGVSGGGRFLTESKRSGERLPKAARRASKASQLTELTEF